MLLIALNCVSLAMDVPAYTCDVQWANLLEAVELFFTVAFAVELMINCLGLGVFEYVRNPWNRLDAVVAVSCVVLVVVEAVAGTAEPFAGQSQGCAGKGDAFPGISGVWVRVRVCLPLLPLLHVEQKTSGAALQFPRSFSCLTALLLVVV